MALFSADVESLFAAAEAEAARDVKLAGHRAAQLKAEAAAVGREHEAQRLREAAESQAGEAMTAAACEAVNEQHATFQAIVRRIHGQLSSAPAAKSKLPALAKAMRQLPTSLPDLLASPAQAGVEATLASLVEAAIAAEGGDVRGLQLFESLLPSDVFDALDRRAMARAFHVATAGGSDASASVASSMLCARDVATQLPRGCLARAVTHPKWAPALAGGMCRALPAAGAPLALSDLGAAAHAVVRACATEDVPPEVLDGFLRTHYSGTLLASLPALYDARDTRLPTFLAELYGGSFGPAVADHANTAPSLTSALRGLSEVGRTVLYLVLRWAHGQGRRERGILAAPSVSEHAGSATRLRDDAALAASSVMELVEAAARRHGLVMSECGDRVGGHRVFSLVPDDDDADVGGPGDAAAYFYSDNGKLSAIVVRGADASVCPLQQSRYHPVASVADLLRTIGRVSLT